jgi:hypothetical protein
LRKATISCVISVRPSVRPRWTTQLPLDEFFKKFDIWVFFSQICKKIQVSFKSDRNNTTDIDFVWYFAEFFLEWEMFQTKAVEKIKTHILYSITLFLRKSCCLWDNVEKYCRAGQAAVDNKIWHMGIACWIPQATHTYPDYVILIAFPLQQWLHERASMLWYTYSAVQKFEDWFF